MRSKLLILAILLLSIMVTGQALAATVTVTPSQVPKGAYVNGPNGATDDNYYWQSIRVNFADAHVVQSAAGIKVLTITMPTNMTVADVNGGGNYAEHVSVSWFTASNVTFAVDAATTGSSIVIHGLSAGGTDDIAADDSLCIMFPVVTQANPSVSSEGYAIDIETQTVTDPDLTSLTGPQVTYRDAGALQLISFKTNLSGDNDSTSTDGQVYPAAPAALFSDALPDIAFDFAAAEEILVSPLTEDGVDTNDITYTLWAAKDSTLSHVSALASGVTRAVESFAGGNFTVNEGNDGSTVGGNAASIVTAGLSEGEYYFYITSSLTGDFPLARSGKLLVQHYPNVKILGWDYEDDGDFDNTVGATDDFPLTLDTGGYLGYDGTLAQAARQNADIYINVDDYDDNARVYLFYSASSALAASDIVTSGTAPNLTVTGLAGATLLADTLYENKKDTQGFLVWNWDVTPVDTSYLPANPYTLYAVACDGKHTSIRVSSGMNADKETITVQHSPNLKLEALAEYDGDVAAGVQIDNGNYDTVMLSWGKQGINGDSDIDDAATIELYIGSAAGGLSDYASTEAAQLRLAANTPGSGVHRIASGLSENADSKPSAYYAWNLKDDFKATGWSPTAAAAYVVYGIIDEGKTDPSATSTARVVGLGDDVANILTDGEALTPVYFSNRTYAHLIDPPAGGVTISSEQTYRLRFNAFDYDNDASLDIFAVKATATGYVDAPMTTTVAALGAAPAGSAYCLNSTDGDDLNAVAISENSATYYDLTMRLPSENTIRYTTDINNSGTDMADGTYWLYIGNPNAAQNPGATLYRALGEVTFTHMATAYVPSQKNLMIIPGVFTVSQGDTITLSLNAADQDLDIDGINAYIAVEKKYFDVVSPATPFTLTATDGNLLANTVFNDSTNGRWILNAMISNNGGNLTVNPTNLGSSEATFRLVSKGTASASTVSSSVYLMNEPGKVSVFTKSGETRSVNIQQNTVYLKARGSIAGIVKLEDRDNNKDLVVTFDLRNRGSYESVVDTAFSNANDANPTLPGIQYTLLDTKGSYKLTNVPNGEYDFVVMYDRYLAQKREINMEAGLDTLDVFFDGLLGGDCTGYTDSTGAVWPNNRIDVSDVSRISDAYYDTADSSKWNDGTNNYKWADITEDGIVDLGDLTLATKNFSAGGTDGAHPVWAKALAGDNSTSKVELNGLPCALVAGQSYTFQVVISGASSIRSYEIGLAYDTNAISITSLAKGSFISGSSWDIPSYGDGAISLVSAVFGDVVYSGSGVLAEVTFTAEKSGAFSSDMVTLNEVKVINGSLNTEKLLSLTSVDIDTPSAFALGQNFPNPFNPTTTITFNVPERSDVTLKIYDVLGRNIRTLAAGNYAVGNYSVVWDARDTRGSMVSSGTYFYSIKAGNYHATKRMLFLK